MGRYIYTQLSLHTFRQLPQSITYASRSWQVAFLLIMQGIPDFKNISMLMKYVHKSRNCGHVFGWLVLYRE